MDAMRTAATAALIAGAAGSLGFMLRAGRHNSSAILLILFAGWVLSPFAALLRANMRGRLRGLSLAIAAGSLVIYGAVVLGPPVQKIAGVFLVIPAASWLLMGIFAFTSRTR
jgi:hypothetical protein